MTADSSESPRATQLIVRAFRASPDAITISRLRDGLLLEVNAGFERIAGYSRAEAIGRTTNELRLWSDFDRDRMVEAIEHDGHADNMSFAFRRKGGELRHCLFSCELLDIDGEACLVAVTRDVTESRVIEAKLRASEEKFAKAFRSSPDAITISRLRDGLFLDVNDGFQELSGYGYDEAVGKRATDLGLWLDDDRERIVDELGRAGKVANAQLRYRMKSGEIRDFLLSGETIELDGEACFVAISRDVTALKNAERERERLVETLESQKAELEQFAYTVSHDLKSPLVTILGFLGLAELDARKEGLTGILDRLAPIRTAAEGMNRHLRELLELSRVGRVINPPEEVSLTKLARAAAAPLASLLEERGVELLIAEEMPTVSGDRFRLLEVVRNLIENGLKFMGDQSRPRIEVGAEIDGEKVICSVRDNGVGIPARYLDRVFDLFERLDPTVEGSGVGLAMVRRIVEVHGGRTWIESPGPGRGSTVYFSLPRSA